MCSTSRSWCAMTEAGLCASTVTGCWGLGVWVRSTWLSTPGCRAVTRSRSCPPTYQSTLIFARGSTARPTSPRHCSIPTSWECTTVASSTASCGSRWTSSHRRCTPSSRSLSRRHARTRRRRDRLCGRQRIGLRPQARSASPRRQAANIMLTTSTTTMNSESC
jgi:hypothetical protein